MQIEDRVSEILKTKGCAVLAVAPTATVFEALRIIADKDVGSVLVMNGSELLGVLSEREYARKVALEGRNSRTTLVTEVMFSPPLTVTPETRIHEAMRLMTELHIRHLPVLDGGGAVVGVVSIGDLVKWTISVQEQTIQHLESYITGEYGSVTTNA
jgi:CBS domain-containing protein